MKQPPAIPPAPTPGPLYDPMDRIVEDMENIESFYSYLDMNPHDLAYLNKHLPGILALRRTIAQQLDLLVDEPYNYPHSRLQTLHQDNENVFIFLEHVIGTMNPLDERELKKAIKALDEAFLKFDDELTP